MTYVVADLPPTSGTLDNLTQFVEFTGALY